MAVSQVPANIRQIISAQGLKNRAVAAKAGFSEQQFSAILNGRKIIKDTDLITIAEALGVTPNELFGVLERKEPRTIRRLKDGVPDGEIQFPSRESLTEDVAKGNKFRPQSGQGRGAQTQCRSGSSERPTR